MKTLLAFIIVIFVYGYAHGLVKSKLCPKKYDNIIRGISSSKDSIVLIRLGKGNLSVNWNNSKNQIVEDILFKDLKYRYKKYENYLIDQITNLSETSASTCGKADKLVIGDLAFLIIQKINHLPIFEITKVQFDSIEKGCPYPVGYFDVISKDRSKIKERVKLHLLH
jgi:hypothetical protein